MSQVPANALRDHERTGLSAPLWVQKLKQETVLGQQAFDRSKSTTMISPIAIAALFAGFLVNAAPPVPATPEWTIDLLPQSSGIVVLEAIVVSPTLTLFFDRASDDPLQINGHSAWGALFNLETHDVTVLDVITNSWCASGALLSNGTMVYCPTLPLASSVAHR